MKRILKLLGVFFLCGFIGVSSPVSAQTTDNATGTTASADDNDDDIGKWGLAGLLGLLGLLGLKRRDDDRHRTNVNR